MSTAEKKLQKAFKKSGHNNVKTNARISGHTVDFMMPKSKLIIEVDGKQHTLNPKQITRDLRRDTTNRKKGFDTVRISNEVVNKNPHNVARSLGRFAKFRRKRK